MKKLWKFLPFVLISVIYFTLTNPESAHAMHIMEGFLPVKWAVFWLIVFIPFLVLGLIRIRKLIALDKNNKLLLALCPTLSSFFLHLKSRPLQVLVLTRLGLALQRLCLVRSLLVCSVSLSCFFKRYYLRTEVLLHLARTQCRWRLSVQWLVLWYTNLLVN